MTIRMVIFAVPVLFVGWIGVMAAVMLATDAAPAAVVFFPSAGFADALPKDAAIMSSSRFTLTVKSQAPGLGVALYRAGAWLVLPAGLTGCLPLPRS